MQTRLSEKYINTQLGQEAEAILRSCVHCGFCTATCPTYQILGDELDGPRGRIYLIKQMFEGEQCGEKTQRHLDRCLGCRACETTCPSGVRYGRLLDIGRELINQRTRRSFIQTASRNVLRKVLPFPKRFEFFLRIGQGISTVLPQKLKRKIPARQNTISTHSAKHSRKMLVLQGCVQSVATPNTNAAASAILDKLGIELEYVKEAGCCGAISHHLSKSEEALNFMRANIDAWWPFVDKGIEAIVTTASGCGVTVKEYGVLLKHDQAYADKAQRISTLARDVSEIVAQEDLSKLTFNAKRARRIAFHSPCTLQHGQKLDGVVERILTRAGFELTHVKDAHLCCGSAGTYSLLQAQLSQQLLDNKITALEAGQPELIATANIGCQLHLNSKAQTPIVHWLELLDQAIK